VPLCLKSHHRMMQLQSVALSPPPPLFFSLIGIGIAKSASWGFIPALVVFPRCRRWRRSPRNLRPRVASDSRHSAPLTTAHVLLAAARPLEEAWMAATLSAWTRDGGLRVTKMEAAASTPCPAMVGLLQASLRRYVSWPLCLLPFHLRLTPHSSLIVNKRNDDRMGWSPPSLGILGSMATRRAIL
jgi:hypothetical protein